MYVLILGLEVLGNPFGLIREFSEGVEAFFYEPYQVKQLFLHCATYHTNTVEKNNAFQLLT